MPSTIRLHRVLRAKPERVYRAFLDPDAKVKWLPPNGFTAKVHHIDARVGGSYRLSFTNFTTGRATLSADSTSNWRPTNEFGTPTNSTIQTYPVDASHCRAEAGILRD